MGTGLTGLSNEMADAVASVAPSVVQVQGGRRPASGVVQSGDIVLTTARALGRGDGLHVRRGDGTTLEAELVGCAILNCFCANSNSFSRSSASSAFFWNDERTNAVNPSKSRNRTYLPPGA